ncbi:MAG: TRAP transporter small permease [Candidatus Aminicenantes bacterium]|jgi:C4-dicarboxylate transporter DctQ subunit
MNRDSNEQRPKPLWKQPLELSLCAILVAIVSVTFIQVLFRYIFHLSLAWSEELARYLFLWLAALASAYAFKLKAHFALRFLVDRFGKGLQKLTNTLVTLVVALFLAIFIWKATEFTFSMAKQVAPSTQMSMAVPYSSAIVGGVLMLYYVVRNWWFDIRNKKRGQ